MKTLGLKMVLALLVGITSSSVYAQGEVTVKVTNVRSATGKVLLSVGSKYAMVSVAGDSVELKLADVPEGKCMLAIFHDENGNYQMDKQIDVPTENCAMKEIVVKSGAQTIEIELQDLRDKL